MMQYKGDNGLPFTFRSLQNALASEQYFLDEITCRKLVHYMSLNKPIGLRGEPGVGKSELPEQMARLMNACLIDIECHSQLEAADIGVSWNSFKQIVDSQIGRLRSNPFTMEYLNNTPLVQSLLSEKPVVVRVDEIDKLNESTTNFFLRYLDKKELVIHDLDADDKVLKARASIYIFLTSNEYRELDPAIMRRIVWIELSFPSEDALTRIIEEKVKIHTAMARRISFIINRLRQLPLKKKPSIGEVLDWISALLVETNGKTLSLDAIQVTLGLLLKYTEDERKGWEEIKSWVEGNQPQD
jgi:MoxR-like ATPase